MKTQVIRKSFTLLSLCLFLLVSLGQTAYAKPAASTVKLTLITSPLNQTLAPNETFEFNVAVKYTGTETLDWKPSADLETTSATVQKRTTFTTGFQFTGSPTSGTFNRTVTITAGSKSVTFNATFIVEDPAEAPLKYLALGDSIPYGRYYTSAWNYAIGGTDTFSYVEQIADDLSILPGNFADETVSGNTASEVYAQLTTLETLVSDADLITLCVGGNDIMEAAGRGFTGLDKHDIDWDVANAGRASFETYWPLIIDRIESYNPDVTLLVMTTYNPYHSDDTYNGENYYNKVDPYFSSSGEVPGINYLITHLEELDNSGTYWDSDMIDDAFDYRVADIYTVFNGYGDGYDDKDALTGFYRSFCDPHPNQTGQNVIFSSHQKLLLDFQ